MRLDERIRGSHSRRRLSLALALALCSCTGMAPRPAPPPQRNETADGGSGQRSAAVLMGSTFQSMQRLAQAPPGEQAELLAAARDAGYERSPQGSAQAALRACCWPPPDIRAAIRAKAQTLLRQLVAQPEALLPLERAVALVDSRRSIASWD